MRVRSLSVAVVAVCLAVLAGCGVGRGSAVAIGPGDPVKVGVLPVADFAPVYIAVDRGYFAQEGIKVELQVMQNAAAIAPSVINGQLQFGTAAITPFIAGAKKGLPLKAIANMADTAKTGATDPSGLVARQGAGITRPRDLEGHTVAVNGLQSIVHVAAAAVIKADGGDPSKVSFVAMPFPDMMPALKQGRIDAAAVVEPFLTMSAKNDATELSPLYAKAFTPGATMGVMFTAGPFIEENPDVVRRFAAALDKASETAAADPDAVRAVLEKYGRLKPDLLKVMKQPLYGTQVSTAAISQASTVMTGLGMLKGPVNGKDVVWP